MALKKELKLKVKISDPEGLKIKLKKIAKYLGKESDVDYFFINETIHENYEFRLRKSIKEKIVTFKIQKSTDSIQENTEFKFSIDDPEDFVSFIETLGFKFVSSIKKVSEIFQKEVISIRLSEVEDLGFFIEITAEYTDESKEEHKEKMLKILEQLEISKELIDNRSYGTVNQIHSSSLSA